MKVLIAEDSATSRLLLERVLSTWGYDVVEVADGTTAWEILQSEDAPRLAILDWIMPGMDGIDVCRLARQGQTDQPPYIILLTALGSKQDLVAGLQAGADDFLSKPFDPDELRARMEVGRRLVAANERLADAHHRLGLLASTDVLTGVFNRRAILERLEVDMIDASRGGTRVSVGLLDVDHFKRVNDGMGHAAGDAVLQQVVARVAEVLDGDAVCGRFGGEEFLILLPGRGQCQTLETLERVRAAVAAAPFEIDGRSLTVTVSLGGATGWNEPVDKLIGRTDTALYEAKEQGRNRVVMSRASRLRLAGFEMELAV